MSSKRSFCYLYGFLILGLLTVFNQTLAENKPSDKKIDIGVAWKSWEPELLNGASKANQLILLLVDKDRCPSCIRESKALNEGPIKNYMEAHYLPVHVSSSERPDLGLYFSQVLQLLKGKIAWPFAVVLLPNGKPVWADGISDTKDLLATLKLVPGLWNDKSGKVDLIQKASDIDTELTRLASQQTEKKDLDEEIFQTFYNRALVQFDREYHGFEKKEKKPPSQILMMLMRIYRRSGAPPAKDMVVDTLRTMRYKNLHDHTNNGFYYGTSDEKWLSPYSEKSMVVNSLLILTYLEAFQLFDVSEFYDVALETADFMKRSFIKQKPFRVLDSMMPDEGKKGSDMIRHWRTKSETAGYSIAALAKLGRAKDTNIHFLDLAEKIAEFVAVSLINNGKLKHSISKGATSSQGFSGDYAAVIFGLTELYFSNANEKWLELAKKLQNDQNELFWDKDSGGYFLSAQSESSVVPRMKDGLDQDTPSTQSLSAFNLLRLADLTNNDDFRNKAVKIIERGGESFERFPLSYPFLCIALDYLNDSSKQLITVGPETTGPFPNELRGIFLPNTVFAFKGPAKSQFPIADSKVPVNGKTTYYICENKVCKFPTVDIKKVIQSLSTFSPYSYSK